MRLNIVITAVSVLLLGACDSPPAQPPQESDLVNATRTDQAYPSTADGNQIVTGSSGPANGSATNGNEADGDAAPAGPSGAGQSGNTGISTAANR